MAGLLSSVTRTISASRRSAIVTACDGASYVEDNAAGVVRGSGYSLGGVRVVRKF